jgi:hypothetical protein
MMIPKSDVTLDTPQPLTVRVQLKNGCGVNGAADEMNRALMESSVGVIFDIIDRGNAEAFNFDKTLVIDRKGDPVNVGAYSKAALAIADRLKVGNDQLLLQKLADNLLDIDVTIIIGSDYKNVLNNLQSEVK